MILTSMVAFVLQQIKESICQSQFADRVENFALFLSQKLELWMFVPCKLVNGFWVVLEEPVYTSPSNRFYNEDYVKEYQEAKDRILFEGFEYDKMGFAYSNTQSECGFDEEYMENKTIEYLLKYNLELTPTAQKQIGI